MSAAANRPLNWNLIAPCTSPQQMAVMENNLAASDYARERGGKIIALTVPCAIESRLNFESGFVLDALNGWREPMALPVEEKMALLADRERAPAPRRAGPGAEPAAGRGQVARAHRGRGLRRGEPAVRGAHDRRDRRDRGPGAPSTCCATSCWPTSCAPASTSPIRGDDDETWKLRVEVWRDERTVLGGTDAGAHLDLLATFNATSAMLGSAVRQRKLLSWEEAVHHITDVPARLYGIKDRGRLAEGWWADVCVIDPERVAARPTYARYDLPGGAWRLYGEADGIDHVLVNGQEIVEPGRVHRRPSRRAAALGSGHQRHRRRLTIVSAAVPASVGRPPAAAGEGPAARLGGFRDLVTKPTPVSLTSGGATAALRQDVRAVVRENRR